MKRLRDIIGGLVEEVSRDKENNRHAKQVTDNHKRLSGGDRCNKDLWVTSGNYYENNSGLQLCYKSGDGNPGGKGKKTKSRQYLPEYLADKIYELNPKVRELAWTLSSRLWRNFNGCQLAKEYICKKWRCKEWLVKATLKELKNAGLIEVVKGYSTTAHTGNIYNIPPNLRREASCSKRMYRSYEEYLLRRGQPRRRRQKIEIFNPHAVKVYKSFAYEIDLQAVYDITTTLPPDEAVRLWAKVSSIPSGLHIPDWVQSKTTGRVHARNPAIQNIPKRYRNPRVFCVPEIYEIDYEAQHANILRVINGKKPIPEIYDRVSEITGVDRDEVKKIVNARIGGQDIHGWAYHKRKMGETPDMDAYMKVDETAKKLIGELRLDIKALEKIGARIMDEILLTLSSWGMLSRTTIPLYDGLVISSETVDIEAVIYAFKWASEVTIGEELPCKVTRL